ncbi:Por secretion system C-terminal sorting domain-containing protein [Lishizhenia tianjinensis]|uniref:Por secretion system C-terminal sorting domain-containing protein n=2 Tax=Lishizhenia tianjinensis TaxID=477690 RepID=A0A1I6Y892_9FLAO|nr:Por secretion system C-terminal sorting domain-containing protein [Lishizhenia tianjinensis]
MLFASLFVVPFVMGQTEVFNEDFQQGVPSTWTIVDNDGLTVDSSVVEFDAAWITYTEDSLYADTVAASTSYFDPIDRADRWLITPPINLGAYGNILNWEAMSADPSFPDDYKVLISTTDNNISSFTDTLILVNNEVPYWLEREVNLSDNGYNDQAVYLAFVNTTFNGFKLFIDDVKVRIDDPLSIENEKLVALTVFPNPTSDMMYISSSKAVNFSVINLEGQVVIEPQIGTECSMAHLPQGVYFLQYEVNGSYGVERIVKQ